MFALHYLIRLSAGLILLLSAAAPAQALQYLWDGGGSDGNMNSSANWMNNLLPPNDGTATLNFRGTAQLSPYTLTMRFVDGIAFPNDGTTQFTLSGARLFVGDGGINHYRGWTQTINNAIDLETGVNQHQWIANPGFLELHGDIDLNNIVTKVSGSGEVRLFGDVSSTNGSIDVGWTSASHPAGTLQLSGLVNVDVDTHIGTLVIDTDQPQPTYTTLQFSNGTSFRSLGTHNITQSLQLTGDVSYDGSGILRSESTISGSGNLVVDASASAILGLGSVNNFSPFSGDVDVIQGTLELNGDGLIAQLDGAMDVGDHPGAAASAKLLAPTAGVIANNSSLTVRRAGLVDMAGPISFSSLSLIGGDLVVDAPVTADPIAAGGSTRTATLDAQWSTPADISPYVLSMADGSANPDLRLLQGCVGAGMLYAGGAGQVELNGSPAAGPGAVSVDLVDLILNRPAGPSILATARACKAAIRTLADDQLGSACALTLETDGLLDISSHTEHVQSLNMTHADIIGQGALFVSGDLDAAGDVTIEPYVTFTPSSADIDVASGGSFSSDAVFGNNLFLLGGGLMFTQELNSNFTVSDGTLRYMGFVDGDLAIDDELEIPWDFSGITSSGDITCGSESSLIIDFDPALFPPSNTFTLLEGQQISGDFLNVQYPPAPSGHFWSLEYTDTQLILHLDPIAQAELDMRRGSNGYSWLYQEGLEGVAGMDFTVQGFDDVELCSVFVDSLMSPLDDSTVGVRLYDSNNQTLLASTEQFFAQTENLESRFFPLKVLLQPGNAYRLVIYGTGDLLDRPYTPNLAFPYLQSTLLQINGAYREQNQGDIFPTTPLDRFFHVRMTLGPCDLTAAPPETPGHYGLALGSHPNPFNPSTTVSFELPRGGRARVEAFDTRGRHVATLVDETKPAGRFDVQWLGRDDRGQALGSGVYFLRLSHPAGEKVERVTLIK